MILLRPKMASHVPSLRRREARAMPLRALRTVRRGSPSRAG